jgi:AraC-like DNA-binding protein
MTTLREPQFLILAPPPPLDRVLQCVWFANDIGTAGTRERVLPNGVVELIMSLEDAPYGVVRGTAVHTYKRAWLCGTQRGPVVIQAPASGQLVGLRFRPGGLQALWRMPLHLITDEVVQADGFDEGLLTTLHDRLGAVPNMARRLDVVSEMLAPRLNLDRVTTGKVHAAVRALHSRPQTSMRSLAATLGVTHQHLVRMFRDGVGVPPRLLVRILRFDRVVRAVGERAERPNWASVAADAGYYDQSHLVSEFRTLAGVTPTEYWSRRLPGGAHLHEEPAPQRT